MDFPTNTSYHGATQRTNTDCRMTYPAFAAPTPVNVGKTTYAGNTLTPGMIPSPLNFPSITPPNSPYGLYNLYSPISAPRPSPVYDPMYLRRLKNNPMFRDLQSLLVQECLQMQIPASLITTSWNLMKLNQDQQSANQNPASSQAPSTSGLSTNQNPSNCNGSGQTVYMQHMNLQDKLLKVRIDPAISADGLSVENDYSKEVGVVEMDRYRALNSCENESTRNMINSYYDKQRLRLIDRTEESLDKLIKKAENMRQAVMKTNNRNSELLPQPVPLKSQPVLMIPNLTEGASLLLKPADEKDKFTAVRKLKFNPSNDKTNDNGDGDDYINCSVNSDDFEIDEIDVITVEKTSDNNKTQNGATKKNNVGTDILKQCILESGIEINDAADNLSNPDDNHVKQSNPDNNCHLEPSQTNSNGSVIADSTGSASDSPISMSSNEHSTNGSTDDTNPIPISTDNCIMIPQTDDHGSASVSPIIEQQSLNTPMNSSKYLQSILNMPSTSNADPQFTNPDALSMALSEIQKLCGEPTVNFTPELRKDSTMASFTPDASSTMSNNPFLDNPSTSHYGESNVKGSSGIGFPHRGQNMMPGVPYHHQQQRQQNNHQQQRHQHNHPQQRHQHNHQQQRHQHNHQQHDKRHNHHRQQQHHHKGNRHQQGHQLHGHKYHQPHQNQQQVAESQHQQKSKEIDIQNNNLQVNQTNKGAMGVTRGAESTNGEFKFENAPIFRSHRILTPEATETLTTWYNSNVQYPYPNDDQVAELSQKTGITARQVKKWMANKRIRSFNTLSITGNQHPIKYKYKGQGRKRKAEPLEKENRDSTTSQKRPNYTMLSENAKQILGKWYDDHIQHPYPNDYEKQQLAIQCEINVSQVKSWFANKRNRSNNTKRQVPNYFIHKFPQYSHMVQMVGQLREEERMLKRRKMNEFMYIQPPFFI